MRKGTAAGLAVTAGAAASASFATTGPGAVLHALCTSVATVGTFVACYSVAAVPAEVRAARRAGRQARRRTSTELPPLEPGRTLSVDEVREHWGEDEPEHVLASYEDPDAGNHV